MRTSNICPTCSTFTNALCTLYNGPLLSTLNINPLDSLETVIQKIETFAAASDGATPNLQAVTDIGAITTNTITLPSIKLDLAAGITVGIGELAWNANEQTYDLGVSTASTLQLGQEDHYQVTNSSGGDILDGTPVMAIGTLGASGKILVAPMDATVRGNSKFFLGLATETIPNGSNGKITKWGKLSGLNTSGSQYGEVWSDNDVIWIDNTVVGGLTNVEPTVGIKLPIAFVIRAHAVTGIIHTRAFTGNYLHELHDIDVTGLTDDMFLHYNSSTENWETKLIDKPFIDALGINATHLESQTGSYYLDYTNFTNIPQLAVTKTLISNEYLTSYDAVTGAFTTGTVFSEVANSTPVENSYPSTVEMIADQLSQTTSYFQYIISGDTYYEYLGTTVGDITDYRELTPTEQTILKGKQITPIHLIYASEAALLANQKKQIKGFIYRTSDTDTHYEYLGTTNGTIVDYKTLSNFSGLEAIDEGNGIGWRLIGRDPANYGNIGKNAIDLGTYYALATQGAVGEASFTLGDDNTASGYVSLGIGSSGIASQPYTMAMGWDNTASGWGSVAWGSENSASGTSSFAFGQQNTVASYAGIAFGMLNVLNSGTVGYNFTAGARNAQSGSYGATIGIGLINKSNGTVVVGTPNNDYTNTNGTLNLATAPRFIVGNGNIAIATPNTVSTRSDAFIVRHNGEVTAPSMTTALIDAEATGKALVTREWVEGQGFGIGIPSLQAVTDVGAITTNRISAQQLRATGVTPYMVLDNTLSGSTTTDAVTISGGANEFKINVNVGGANRNIFHDYSNLTTFRRYYYPNADGTIALTSDITVYDLQAVCDIGNTTTTDIAAATFNDLELFAQTGVDVDNIGIGASAMTSNTGTNVIAIGSWALQNNTQHNALGIGYQALQNNTGSYATGVGGNALQNNIGNSCTGFGYQALINNRGQKSTSVGIYALASNTADNCNAVGWSAGYFNTGVDINAMGTSAAQHNLGNFVVGIGGSSLIQNTTSNVSAFGYRTLRYNQNANNTAVGYNSFSTFHNNVAGNVTFDNTDINDTTSRITITAHGLGSTGTWVNVLLTEGTSSVLGWQTATIKQVKIIDANTISTRELIAGTTYHGDAIQQGTGTGHTLTPQFNYSNVTVLGANAEPTKSNQVVLGDANVVEVAMGNGDIIYPIPAPDLTGYVPYTGATADVDLGMHKITLGLEETVTDKAKHQTFLYEGANALFRHQTHYWNGSSYLAADSLGFGVNALKNNTGTSSNAFGASALLNNTKQDCNGFGRNVLYNNTGNGSNGFGNSSLFNNSGNYSNGFGEQALFNNSGVGSNGFGHSALLNNTGTSTNGFGNSVLYNNIGSSSNGFGSSALQNNTGESSSGFGNYALQNNTGNNSNSFGYNSLFYNQKDYNTAIGHQAYSIFLDNVAGNKTFDFTDIDAVTDRIIVTAHGFGTNGTWVNLKYTQGTSSISGLFNTNIYQVKIIDANTLGFRELISGVIYHGTNISAAGIGTGHTLTPQFAYENTTSLGANSVPTKDNQVVLGDTSVTEVKTAGTYVSGGYTVATLPTGVTGARAYVTDATATTFYSVVVGGGANVVPVFYNGTDWVIA